MWKHWAWRSLHGFNSRFFWLPIFRFRSLFHLYCLFSFPWYLSEGFWTNIHYFISHLMSCHSFSHINTHKLMFTGGYLLIKIIKICIFFGRLAVESRQIWWSLSTHFEDVWRSAFCYLLHSLYWFVPFAWSSLILENNFHEQRSLFFPIYSIESSFQWCRPENYGLVGAQYRRASI